MTRLDERLISRAVGGLKTGRLTVYWPDGRVERVAGTAPGPEAELVVRDPTVARRIALGGATGFAEGYMDESWDTPDLVALLDLFAGNMLSSGMRGTPARSGAPGARLMNLSARQHAGGAPSATSPTTTTWATTSTACGSTRRSPTRARCSVAASSRPRRLTGGADDALREAQIAKWDRLLDLLQPQPGERILEIGCGWGGFAIHAAQTRGCRVTGITLSEEQLASRAGGGRGRGSRRRGRDPPAGLP